MTLKSAGQRTGRTGSPAYFDQVAAEYADWYRAATPGAYALRTRKRHVLDLLEGRTGRILDVGCGPGLLAQELAQRGWEFWGLDASPRMIDQCLRRFAGSPETHFAVGDAAALPYAGGLFHAVVCLGVIDRVPAYERAIREMIRVLRPGGLLLISFPNVFSPYALWRTVVFYPVLARLRAVHDRLTRRPPGASLLSEYVRLHSARGVITLMERHGAIVSAVDYQYYNLLLSPLDELFPRLALLATERLEWLSRSRLRWLGAGFIVRAHRPARDR